MAEQETQSGHVHEMTSYAVVHGHELFFCVCGTPIGDRTMWAHLEALEELARAQAAEVERLRAENAALREIAQAVAALSDDGQNDLCDCYTLGNEQSAFGQRTHWRMLGRPHEDTCMYNQARALLAGDAQGKGTASDE